MAARPGFTKRVSIDNSALEYDAEKAYILATTATSTPSRRASRTSTEFDFSLSQSQLQSAFQAMKGAGPAGEDHLTSLGEEGEERDFRDGPEEEDVKLKPLPADPSSPADADQRVLVVYGPTGCGKSHLFRKLVHSNRSIFSPVVSHTTRQRRPTEIGGVDFHFISHEEMASQTSRGGFIEYVRVPSSGKDSQRDGKKKKKKKKRRTGHGGRVADLVEGPQEGLLDSVFDLTEEDKPSSTGEVFGTSWQALEEAKMQRKPCVVLNVGTSGARQLREAGIKATFVLLCPEGDESDNAGIQPDYIISTDSFDRAFSELQQFAFGLVQDVQAGPGTTRDVTEDEWRIVPTWNIDPKGTTRVREITQPQRSITFNELLVHYMQEDLSRQTATLRHTKEEKQRKSRTNSFSHLLRGSGGKQKLSKKLKHERDLVFAIAQCPLSDQEGMHVQALQTIYRQLTGSPSPGRYGRHWEDVGFHGMDPADDLRGVGFLGLMQLVSLLENPRSLPLAREMYRLSHLTDKDHSVPFCVLSLNLTQAALTSLREGHLTQLCNKRDQVFVVLNEFHVAMLYHYFHIWKTQSKTIEEVGTLIQEVAQFAQRNTKTLLRETEAYLDTYVPRSTVGHTRQRSSEDPFTPLDQLQQLADTTTTV